MTIADHEARLSGLADFESARELRRGELADLLELDPAALTDRAHLSDDLHLDSLAMMVLLTWMETHGVVVSSRIGQPTTVGEVLALLDQVTHPSVSIRFGNGSAPVGAGHQLLPPPASPLAPVLSNQTIRLTPISPDDVRFLYTLAVQPETGFRWRYRGTPPPVERFVSDLWHQVLVQFVARCTDDNEPVGHVVAYGADMGHGYAYLGAVFQPLYNGTGLAAQATQMFVRYLFHVYPLRKLYLEIPGFNWPQMSSGENKFFTLEGRLRDHEHYAGRTWDRYLCAIYPEGARPDSEA